MPHVDRKQVENHTSGPGSSGGQVQSLTPPATPLILQRAYADPSSLTPKDVKHLQRTIGNRAVVGLLSRSTGLQAKLKLGAAGDRYEQEANHVAEQVVSASRLSTPPVQREGADTGMIQKKPLAASVTPIQRKSFQKPTVQRDATHSIYPIRNSATRTSESPKVALKQNRLQVQRNFQASEETKKTQTIATKIRADLAKYFSRTVGPKAMPLKTPGFGEVNTSTIPQVPREIRDQIDEIPIGIIRNYYIVFFLAVDNFLKDESIFGAIMKDDTLYNQLYYQSMSSKFFANALTHSSSEPIDNYITYGYDREEKTSLSKGLKAKREKAKFAQKLISSRESVAKMILPLLSQSETFSQVEREYAALKQALSDVGAGVSSLQSRMLFNQENKKELKNEQQRRKQQSSGDGFFARRRRSLMETSIQLPEYNRSLLDAMKKYKASVLAVTIETIHDLPEVGQEDKNENMDNSSVSELVESYRKEVWGNK